MENTRCFFAVDLGATSGRTIAGTLADGKVRLMCVGHVLLEDEILCVIVNYRVKDDMALVKDTDEIAGQVRKFYPKAFFVLSRSFSSIQITTS